MFFVHHPFFFCVIPTIEKKMSDSEDSGETWSVQQQKMEAQIYKLETQIQKLQKDLHRKQLQLKSIQMERILKEEGQTCTLCKRFILETYSHKCGWNRCEGGLCASCACAVTCEGCLKYLCPNHWRYDGHQTRVLCFHCSDRG